MDKWTTALEGVHGAIASKSGGSGGAASERMMMGGGFEIMV